MTKKKDAEMNNKYVQALRLIRSCAFGGRSEYWSDSPAEIIEELSARIGRIEELSNAAIGELKL